MGLKGIELKITDVNPNKKFQKINSGTFVSGNDVCLTMVTPAGVRCISASLTRCKHLRELLVIAPASRVPFRGGNDHEKSPPYGELISW